MTDSLLNQGFKICANMTGFSELMGPFYEQTPAQKNTEIVRALPLEKHHLNPEGVVHGGVVLSFMDYVIYRGIADVVSHDIQFATINLNTNFLAAAKAGEVLYGTGRITRRTRSVIFAEGIIYNNERQIMTGSGIWKVIGQK